MDIKRQILIGQIEMLVNGLQPGEVISTELAMAAADVLSRTCNELKMEQPSNGVLTLVSKSS